MKALLTILAALALSGCANYAVPPMSRHDQLAMTTRIYPDTTPEQVIAAAEKVLKLADGDDMQVAHGETGFEARRRWLVYIVIGAAAGVDHWSFRATSTPDGTRATVAVNQSSQGLSPSPVVTQSSSGMGVGTGPAISAGIISPALYDLFWRRVDFVLERPGSTWLTCQQWATLQKTQRLPGIDDPLCNSFNMTDSDPTKPASEQEPPKPSAYL
jgi:hypothetical protein